MAEFPPNLDDGELWLPSDIFHNEIPCMKMKMEMEMEIDRLNQRFAALRFLQRNPTPTPAKPPPLLAPHSFQRFRPSSSYDSFESRLPGYLKVNLKDGYGVYAYETDASVATLKPPCRYHLLRETQAQHQVERFLEARARILHDQKNHVHNRSPPLQGNTVRSRTGIGRGTGVFLPRVVNITTTTTPASVDHRKRQGMRIRHENRVSQQRNCTKMMGMVKNNGEYHYQHNPEMRLPQDWTY